MVIVYSATKGLAAMTMAIAHSQGWLDYEERVAHYWPEFAQNGKDTITVRQLLAHQAGLFALDEPVDRSVVADVDRLSVVLARQRPACADVATVAQYYDRGCCCTAVGRSMREHQRFTGCAIDDA